MYFALTMYVYFIIDHVLKGFNRVESEKQKSRLQMKLTALEKQAHFLAGHYFSLTSLNEISDVLFIQLQLPTSGSVTASTTTNIVTALGEMKLKTRYE